MRPLPTHKTTLVLRCLVEGLGIRPAASVAEVSHPAVIRLAVDAGRACAEYQAQALRQLPCSRIRIDAVWSFASAPRPGGANAPRQPGDVWTWTAVCVDTGLVPAWRVGDRSPRTEADLVGDLRARVADSVVVANVGTGATLAAPSPVQTARDGAVAYPAVADDGQDEALGDAALRVSPIPHAESGRSAGKVARHAAALGLQFMHHNFCRVEASAMRTPAMRAGVTDRLWETGDVARLVEAWRVRRRERRRSEPSG